MSGASAAKVLRNKLILDVPIPSVSQRVDKAALKGLAELRFLCSPLLTQLQYVGRKFCLQSKILCG